MMRADRKATTKITCVYAESRLRTADDKMSEHHWHPYFELFYVEEGACRMMVENEMYDLHTGDFVLIPPQAFHYTRYHFGDCRRGAVFFRKEDVSPEVQQFLPGGELFFGQMRILQTPQPSQVQMDILLHRMVQENELGDEHSSLILRAMLQEMLLRCSRECALLAVPDRIHTTEQEIVCAARFMTEHYTDAITSTDIAAAAGFSPNYLSRKFREATGFGLHEYLVFLRLRHAAQLLAETEKSVTEIALQCGFSDSNYFKDAFKKNYGCTPREYRKNK